MSHIKEQVQSYWDGQPCGSTEVSEGRGSAEFFAAHERMRYEREPMIDPFADFDGWAGRRILEVGVGMGADHVRFRKGGADAIGVDLSTESLRLASLRAMAEGVSVSLMRADAEALPFEESSFDMVYSWGVLMCAPDMPRAIHEVHRVLKPGGECRVMLYNRHSLNAFLMYLYFGLLRGKPLAKVADLSEKHLESPGTKVHTRKEVIQLFHEFAHVEVTPAVTVYDVRLGRRQFAPQWMLRAVPASLGWFLLIRARK